MPPACSSVITISAAERLASSSSLMPVGMPRPLSMTEIELSVWMVTMISSQIAGQRFVDRVVHHLEHHVVQAGAVGGVADVHAGALAHRFKAFRTLIESEP